MRSCQSRLNPILFSLMISSGVFAGQPNEPNQRPRGTTSQLKQGIQKFRRNMLDLDQELRRFQERRGWIPERSDRVRYLRVPLPSKPKSIRGFEMDGTHYRIDWGLYVFPGLDAAPVSPMHELSRRAGR